MKIINPVNMAKEFHDVYETLAPHFGYETREDTKIFDEDSDNGKLMIAVCKIIINEYFINEGK